MPQYLKLCREDIANLQESIEHTEKEIQSKQEQINQLETQLKGLQAEFDKAKDAVEREDVIRTEYLAKLDAHDNEIRLKNQESAAIKKQILELESRKDTVSRAAAAERQKSKACKEKVHIYSRKLIPITLKILGSSNGKSQSLFETR